MSQELGETTTAIVEERLKKIEEIIDANKHLDKFWILLFAKPSKHCVDGKPTLIEHLKAYSTQPPSLVGTIVWEVDNKTGTIKQEVNMPQRPFDFDQLQQFGVEKSNEVIVETATIPGAYVTK